MTRNEQRVLGAYCLLFAGVTHFFGPISASVFAWMGLFLLVLAPTIDWFVAEVVAYCTRDSSDDD